MIDRDHIDEAYAATAADAKLFGETDTIAAELDAIEAEYKNAGATDGMIMDAWNNVGKLCRQSGIDPLSGDKQVYDWYAASIGGQLDDREV
jgi:hypothetical protein